MTTAIWMWHHEGTRYAIEPCNRGGYDTVVEYGLENRPDREHWANVQEARDRVRGRVAELADSGDEGAKAALAELDQLIS
ncbi:hypothetical protein [Amycolatopsis palatopharyngis]|uniref:hypothetical protein n=1 Tax=Amycolatopsis palatopharyngis TaxID=187982 RepID=UPI000E2578C8|nr:hypothetical protein [Amycolatopsis palatopharyngis]